MGRTDPKIYDDAPDPVDRSVNGVQDDMEDDDDSA